MSLSMMMMMMMNIKSNHQQQLLQVYHHNQISSFNPACCLRPSVEEHGQHGRHGSKKEVIGPPSPRMGCMGQIKRSGSYNDRSSSSNKKLFQFLRMFSSSGKGSATTMVSPRTTAMVEDKCCRQGISIADTMDPPLPVLKHQVVARDANACSIWTRRHGGDRLRSLEIAQVKMQHMQHLRRSFSGMKNFDEVQA